MTIRIARESVAYNIHKYPKFFNAALAGRQRFPTVVMSQPFRIRWILEGYTTGRNIGKM